MKTYAAKQQLTRIALALLLHVPLLSAAASHESLAAMDWPLQPKESLRDLSRLIYPKSPSMQQRFVAEAIRLNRETQPELQPTTVFEQEHQVLIPSIRQLSKKR